MELILTILLFAICGAVCMKLFAASHKLGTETWELNNAVSTAQGFAEVMRGTDGSMEEIMALFPSAVRGGEANFEVFYDSDFKECEYTAAKYISDVTLYNDGAIRNIDVRIIRQSDYEEIYSLLATKYMNSTEE